MSGTVVDAGTQTKGASWRSLRKKHSQPVEGSQKKKGEKCVNRDSEEHEERCPCSRGSPPSFPSPAASPLASKVNCTQR